MPRTTTQRKHQFDVFYEVLALYYNAESLRFEKLIADGAHPRVIQKETQALDRQIKTFKNSYLEETKNDTNDRTPRSGADDTSPSGKTCGSDNSGPSGSNEGRSVCSENRKK